MVLYINLFILESVSLLTGNRLMNTIKSNLPTIPVNELANQYNSVIYNARESINAGLIKVMPTPVYNAVSPNTFYQPKLTEKKYYRI